jgi:demethylmenaquinone methyltransferase/2-methoxy-6-polyprenyl-1,4-benzoquinol methylase|tara:strand:+ start:118 stop:741 length:624 start_codon:yes stop_codon:yes gene_type:complete
LNESANFSNIHKFYDFVNSLTTLGFDKSWRKQAAKKLNPGSVLDLGSGTGASYTDLINFDVTALDPDEQMLSLNNFEKKVVGKGEELPFKENSFDNVLCCFVWRNVSDTEKALSEVYRVLKPGGKFILLDMTRPKNSFLKIIHKIGTYILLHFVGFITLNLKEYSFLYKSLDFYPQPEVHLSKNNYTNLVIERVGLFDFVYLGVFTK